MSIRSRLISIIGVLCLLIMELHVGFMDFISLSEREEIRYSQKEKIRLWYTDDALTDYLNSVALEFYEDTDIRVATELVSGSEYLERISDASLNGEEAPDLYIVGNDSLGKAYLAGLAMEIDDGGKVVNRQEYPMASMDAVTFLNRTVAYPFYFETSYLLYNKTYLEKIATDVVKEEYLSDGTSEDSEDEEYGAEEELAPEILLSEEFSAKVEAKMKELLPNSIEDILDFADEYDAPENVETIFEWDVSDIYYNYFFLGNYLNVGGNTGDDPNNINIYNASAISCLETYQDLNQFFSIDAETVDYASIIRKFIEGKLIFTVATTDAVATIEQHLAEGEFAYEYGVMKMPNVNDVLKTRSLSTTNVVAINGYSEHTKAANRLAAYITHDRVDDLYIKTGKMPARLNLIYPYPELQTILYEYAQSISMPKMIETSNFWIELELCFTKAWQGEDANLLLKALSEEMKMQITGFPVEEEYIIMPEKEPEEYIDEGMN